MSSPTEIYDIGHLGNGDGMISVSYIPEHNSVTLHASVPSDRRRADIVIRVTGATALRNIVDNLEATIEVARQKQAENESLSIESDGVALTLMNTRLLIPSKVFKNISDLVIAGNNDAVLKEIKKEFPLLTDKGVSEMAYLVYKHLRPRVTI
jgi:hypothetical protein